MFRVRTCSVPTYAVPLTMNSHQRWLATKSSELDKRMAAAGPRLPGEYDVFGDGGDGEGSHGNKVMVDGYSGSRFSINGVLLPGPLFLLPTLPLAWNVTSLDELSPESLALAYAIRPRVSILILGCGQRIKMINPQLRDFFRQKGISIEALDTWNAVATWNILNQEDRAVAAALMPFDYE